MNRELRKKLNNIKYILLSQIVRKMEMLLWEVFLYSLGE